MNEKHTLFDIEPRSSKDSLAIGVIVSVMVDRF